MDSSPTYLSIDAVPTVDDTNYLQVDFRAISNEVSAEGFQEALAKLWLSGRALERINQQGQLHRVDNLRSYYFQAVKWLKGQEQTSDFIALSPLAGDDANKTSLAQQFVASFMPGYLDNFFNNAIASGFYASAQTSETSVPLQEAERSLRSQIPILQRELKSYSDNEINRAKAAVALQKWQSYYDELISSVPEAVNNTAKKKVYHPLTLIDGVIYLLYKKLSAGLSKNIFQNTENYCSQMKHFKLWKNIWLLLFVLAEIVDNIIVHAILKWTYSNNAISILSITLATAVFFGSQYVSANKNYRIYANLYDQTLFRSVVAKTLQGIIMDDERLTPEYKQLLLTVAAQSLFEMKPNGHLTKKESASPINELVTALISRPAS